MKAILKASEAMQVRKGLFNIDLNLPGLALQNREDPQGYYQLGRFDHAHLYPGVFVGMHLHRNDEILTYMREGVMVHEDSSGVREEIHARRLMMMNAGKGFYHQESIPEDGSEVKLLQIFIRPRAEDLTPAVQFAGLQHAFSEGQWRLVASGETADAPLIIQSDVSVFDRRLSDGIINLPSRTGYAYLLHVFDGQIRSADATLQTGDSLLYEDEEPRIEILTLTDVVLFELNTRSAYSRRGMYSGT